MIIYPADLPCPDRDDYTTGLDEGVITSNLKQLDHDQRKVFPYSVQTFGLNFTMNIEQYKRWMEWVQGHGFQWFTMDLRTWQAGENDLLEEPTVVRFKTDINVQFSGWDRLVASVQAEAAPSEFHPTDFPGDSHWIIAGDPEDPSFDTVIAGDPANPSRDYVRAGVPALPNAEYPIT